MRFRVLLFSLIVGGLILMSTSTQARGLRNNNPGNIRHSRSNWDGKSVAQTDPAFVQFDRPVDGIRAMAKVLLTYFNSYSLTTVRQIISRWAPSSDNNDTGSYIFAVASRMGVGPDQELEFPDDLDALVTSIITHENGSQPYPPKVLSAGVIAAFA